MKKQPKIKLPYSKYNTDDQKSLLPEEFTIHELNEAIKIIAKGKAVGIDDINTELLKQLGPNCRKWLLKCFMLALEKTTSHKCGVKQKL